MWILLRRLPNLASLRHAFTTDPDEPKGSHPPYTTKRKSCDFLSAVRGGFEPPVQLPVRQFSKLVVSATHPSHQNCLSHMTGLQI